MKKVLVAGATGALGGFVVKAFRERGYWVRALARSEGQVEALREHVNETFVGTATDPDSLKEACEGIDILFSSIGITKQKEGGAYWLMGLATYGAAAGGVVLHVLANNDYNNYKDATNAMERNAYFESATSKANIRNILFYSAAGIWIANMVWTILTPNKVKSAFSLHATFDPVVNKPMISMTVKF